MHYRTVNVRAWDRVEVKALMTREVGFVVVDEVVGTVEHWAKWSFLLAADASGQAELGERPQTWGSVAKRRWLVARPRCAIEFARADLSGPPWWSLAVECDSAGDVGRGYLVDALQWVVAAEPPRGLALTEERSSATPRPPEPPAWIPAPDRTPQHDVTCHAGGL